MPKPQPNVPKVLNFAMTSSILVYGVVLQILGKADEVALAASTPLAQAALATNLLLLLTLLFHRKRVVPQKDPAKRMAAYVVCLALNEFIALVGFVVVFLGDDGNGFPFAANALVAITGNFLIFPRET